METAVILMKYFRLILTFITQDNLLHFCLKKYFPLFTGHQYLWLWNSSFSEINQFLFQSQILRQMDVELSVIEIIIMFISGAYGLYISMFCMHFFIRITSHQI